jgi:hypothetical protein
MTKNPLVLTDAAEAAVVNQIVVWLIRPEEVAKWERSVIEQRYLKSARSTAPNENTVFSPVRSADTASLDPAKSQHFLYEWLERAISRPK